MRRTSKEFERNGILSNRELCSLLNIQDVAGRRAGNERTAGLPDLRHTVWDDAIKTALKAAVFCRLPTDRK
jgi:hypothetical protein